MIHKYNIAELSLVDRPVKGPSNGFGSVVNEHQKGHDKNWRETSQAEAFGYGQKENADQQQAKFTKIGEQSGLRQARPFKDQGVLCISGLMGEVYVTGDPQESTDVQRSWLYTKDASIGCMQRGKID